MTYYRKKPVVIEAEQLIGTPGETYGVAEWVARSGYPWLIGNANEPATLRLTAEEYQDQEGTERPTKGIYIDPATGDLVIVTLEGDMHASHGDYIIKGVKGEFYPCKPDIFVATYEPIVTP